MIVRKFIAQFKTCGKCIVDLSDGRLFNAYAAILCACLMPHLKSWAWSLKGVGGEAGWVAFLWRSSPLNLLNPHFQRRIRIGGVTRVPRNICNYPHIAKLLVVDLKFSISERLSQWLMGLCHCDLTLSLRCHFHCEKLHLLNLLSIHFILEFLL